jgi:hypothetical protein
VVNEETAPGTISVAASENGVTKTSTSVVDCINADGTAGLCGATMTVEMSATAQYGYKGWHACDQGSGFGYSIKVTSCIKRPRPDLGANVIAEYDYFQVHVVAKGVPIYDSKSSWANLHPSGAAYFHWAT